MTILAHCHLYPGGPGEDRRDEFGIAGTSEHLCRLMRACGFDQAQALAPFEKPPDRRVNARLDSGEDSLDWLLRQPGVGLEAGAALLPTATIFPQRAEAGEKLRRARRLGVRLLKFHPLIMQCDPLQPRCAGFFGAAAEARMPMIYHTGAGDWGWPTDAARPEVCAELAARYAALPILMAHCGSFGGAQGFERAVAACEKHANLYLDATAALGPVGDERWRGALDRLGPQRVIYGCDYPWASSSSLACDLEFLDALALDAHARAQVLGGNLMRLWQAATP